MILSIITVNYNNHRGLEKTIKSVKDQKCQDFEYIVIDGGSKDSDLEIIRNNTDIIDHWVSEPDSGIYHAMNKGIIAANGRYCLFLNSGDWLLDNGVIDLINSSADGSDLLIFQMIKIWETGVQKTTNLDILSLDRITENSLPHQSTLINTLLLKKFNGYNLNYKIVADWEFFVKVLLIENCTHKIFNQPISYFGMEGISNNAEHREQLNAERAEIKTVLLNPLIWQAGRELKMLKQLNNNNESSNWISSKIKRLFRLR